MFDKCLMNDAVDLMYIYCISLFCLPYILCMMYDVQSVWVVWDADVFVCVS